LQSLVIGADIGEAEKMRGTAQNARTDTQKEKKNHLKEEEEETSR